MDFLVGSQFLFKEASSGTQEYETAEQYSDGQEGDDNQETNEQEDHGQQIRKRDLALKIWHEVKKHYKARR